jgi:hypothetical protein
MVPSQYAPPPVFDILEPTAPEAAKPRRVLGHLKLGDGTSYELDDSLITIGTRDNCTYKLPISEADFGQGDLRIWQTNGRILIRDTAARPRLRVNGRPVGWTFLGDHDQIEIRGLRFEFELARSADNAIP